MKTINPVNHGIEFQKTPLQAIRSHCLYCMGGSSKEVFLCTSPRCPLFYYRLGVRPATAKALGWDTKQQYQESDYPAYLARKASVDASGAQEEGD